jgi:hypothetical protein
MQKTSPGDKEGIMRVFLTAAVAVSAFVVFGLAHAGGKQKSICLKVNGEKIEIHNLADKPVIIDRDGIPDFASTAMMQSVSTAKGSESYNILVTGVKRDARKAITSFDVKIDDKSYAYPKDSCGK